MSLIANKKFVFIAVFCFLIFALILALVHKERFFILFRESVSLDFQRDDMEHILITTRGIYPLDFHDIRIEEPERIREIISYLNSLELVEAELPRNLRTRINAFEDVGRISIYIGHSPAHSPGDIVEFWANYMVFTYHGHKAAGRYTYFVRNSGFRNRTKASNVYQFLYELISEYSVR